MLQGLLAKGEDHANHAIEMLQWHHEGRRRFTDLILFALDYIEAQAHARSAVAVSNGAGSDRCKEVWLDDGESGTWKHSCISAFAVDLLELPSHAGANRKHPFDRTTARFVTRHLGNETALDGLSMAIIANRQIVRHTTPAFGAIDRKHLMI